MLDSFLTVEKSLNTGYNDKDKSLEWWLNSYAYALLSILNIVSILILTTALSWRKRIIAFQEERNWDEEVFIRAQAHNTSYCSESCSATSNSLPPMDIALQAPLSMGFSRIPLECVAISSSRGSSQPRDWTWVPYIAGRFFFIPSMPPGKPSSNYRYHLSIIYL